MFESPVDYPKAVQIQQTCVQYVQRHPDQVIQLYLSHPAVVTLGRTADASLTIGTSHPVYRSHRGGQVTVHGPGQLTCYSILNLRNRQLRTRDYIQHLQMTIVQVLARLGIAAKANSNEIGVWTDFGKIASIGCATHHGIVWHGYSLYLEDQADIFGPIVPCADHSIQLEYVARSVVYARDELIQSLAVEFSKQIQIAEPLTYLHLS